jgi:hypothetical protein
MITKEMIDNTAKEYFEKEFIKEKTLLGLFSNDETEIIENNIKDCFKAGANYAIQQMSDDAVEFAEWAGLNSWEFLTANKWHLIDLFDDEYGKIRTSQELYQLYLNSKK